MAGKKPAKPIAGQSKQPVQDPAIFGSPIQYLGFKDSPSVCVQCGRQTIRGIIRMKGNLSFCSASCAKQNNDSAAAV